MDKSREMARVYVSADKTDFQVHRAPRYLFLDRYRSMKRGNMQIRLRRLIIWIVRYLKFIFRGLKKKISEAIAKKRYVFNFQPKPFRLYSFRTIISVSKI